MIRRLVDLTYRQARRVVIGVVGGTILLLGIVLIVLPGPAFVVIPAGLAILSIEFAWARRFLHKVREGISRGSRSRRLSRYD
jgi:tellurite resistance protein TerC